MSRDFYRRLADADARELARMIADTAAEPPSTDRDLALAVLLKRHAELDVVGAVRLAREVRVRGAALGTVYSAWARRAPAQVLAALSTIDNPDDAADVALALIVTLGNDARAVERVTAVLAERADEPLLGAGTVPVGPIIAPTVVAPPRSTLGLLAARWAELGPRHALAVARELRDERVRIVFEAAALRAVARVAPNEVFAELTNRSGNSAQLGALGGAVVELARADPERVLSAASGLPVDIRRLAESAAMQQLAERAPAAAVRYLERMPVGMERQSLIRVVARAYGKRDAAAALEWVRSQGGQQGLVAAVIGGVAEQDPQRALDLALELTSPIERMQAVQFAAGFGARTDAEAEAIANRLLSADDATVRESLAFTVVTTWASRSPDSAMRWLLGSGQNASPNVYQQVGQMLAMRDPRNAIGYSAQIPPDAREQWINGVAQGYAQNDPRRHRLAPAVCRRALVRPNRRHGRDEPRPARRCCRGADRRRARSRAPRHAGTATRKHDRDELGKQRSRCGRGLDRRSPSRRGARHDRAQRRRRLVEPGLRRRAPVGVAAAARQNPRRRALDAAHHVGVQRDGRVGCRDLERLRFRLGASLRRHASRARPGVQGSRAGPPHRGPARHGPERSCASRAHDRGGQQQPAPAAPRMAIAPGVRAIPPQVVIQRSN